ncbi:MAG: hypothetical protein ABGY29_12565 [bacterium]
MTQPETTWAVLWTTGIDPVHPNETPTREWEEYDTEAEANAIAAELSTFQPQVSSTAKLKRGVDLVDVVLKSSQSEQRRIDALRQLQVGTVSGGRVPLLQVADLVFSEGFGGFTRVNQEKEVELTYVLDDEITESQELLDEARAAVDELAAELALPPGVSVEVIHDETDLSEF